MNNLYLNIASHHADLSSKFTLIAVGEHPIQDVKTSATEGHPSHVWSANRANLHAKGRQQQCCIWCASSSVGESNFSVFLLRWVGTAVRPHNYYVHINKKLNYISGKEIQINAKLSQQKRTGKYNIQN